MTEPTDVEILELASQYWYCLDETESATEIELVRAALAKWGQPAQAADSVLDALHVELMALRTQRDELAVLFGKERLDLGKAAAARAQADSDLITIRKPTTSAEMLWLLKLAHLVISDVDKTLEESFATAQPAAQQPAPSAATASKAVLAAIRAANMQLVRTGDDEFMLVTYKNAKTQCDGGKCGIGGYCDDCPTAQADTQPAQQGVAYAALPDLSDADGEIWSAVLDWGHAKRGEDALRKASELERVLVDQLRAFADATCALRASHGQAPAGAANAEGDVFRALIKFLLHADDALAFLRCWNEGNFGACRLEWPEAPPSLYPDTATPPLAAQQAPAEVSPTAGMNIPQRILHVGGRNNDAGYVEFGSIQAVEALVRQVLRDLPAQQPAPSPAETVGNSGFDYQTAADVLNGKTVSDEAIRKFVAASRWAHDDRVGLRATLLSVRGELASREAEIALLKNALMDAEEPQPSTTAQAGSVQEDAARLDFLIEQQAYVVSDPDACPGHWLHWARPDGSTWVQGDEHPTPRAAIDAARKQGGPA